MVDSSTNQAAQRSLKGALVDVKNGKLFFRQKALVFEKMSGTMQEIVRFREMLEHRVATNEPPLCEIPDEHKPVIAKMVHESDKTIQSLCRHIQQELLPARDEDEDHWQMVPASLPLAVVDKTVRSLAERINYGLDATDAPNGKIPASWQIWRWEVKEQFYGWLPQAVQDKIVARTKERQQVKERVHAIFLSLTDAQKASIVGNKASTSKASNLAKDNKKSGESSTSKTDTPTPMAEASDNVPPSSPLAKASEADAVEENHANDSTGTKTVGRPKKPVDPEKAAKEKERQEKRLAKAEKEKREQEAQNKSRSLMANFFGKTKGPSVNGSPSKQQPLVEATDASARAERDTTTPPEFERTFKPFTLKKDASLAPENWFRDVRSGKVQLERQAEDVIVIEDDDSPAPPPGLQQTHQNGDVVMADATPIQSGLDLGQMTPQERLHAVLRSLPSSLRPPRLPYPPRRHPSLKSYHKHNIRGIMHDLNEAEISGDIAAVRSLLALLRDRGAIPAKVLIFTEDGRPGYFGTWTRNSREVGPRAPFARDVVSLDYTVDSGEEWEEEEEGDVLEVDDDDEEGAVTEEPDSDLDSWLVDDDDAVDPGTPIDERLGSPDFFPPAPPPKRKTKEPTEEKDVKKRKVVVPLVPFTKGPCWEDKLGESSYEPFKPYHIQMFNDTPFGIDPFKYVAPPEDVLFPPLKTSTNSGFAVPALPTRLSNPTIPIVSAQADSSSNNQKRSVAPPPKTTFPDALIPQLITKIIELDTGNMSFIIESVYKDFKKGTPNVKKNAIEAKIREIATKDKKVWTVKAEIKVLYVKQ